MTSGQASRWRQTAETGMATTDEEERSDQMVELRSLDSESADLFSAAYTRGITSIADIREVDGWDATTQQALKCIAGQLRGQSILPEPIVERPPWATDAVVASLAKNAELCAHWTAHMPVANGKVNAQVALAVGPLLEKLGVREHLEKLAEVRLAPEATLSYILYESPGAFLKLHLDTRSFGDVIALLCLDREHSESNANPSATVAVTGDRIIHVRLQPGECLVMDGPCTPHGRSPLGPDERVSLLVMGYKIEP